MDEARKYTEINELLSNGRIAAAVELSLELLASDSRALPIVREVLFTCVDRRDYDEIIRIVDVLIHLGHAKASELGVLGVALRRKNRYAEARKVFLDRIALTNQPKAHQFTLLADVEARLGMLMDAETHYLRALEIEDGFSDALLGLARLVYRYDRRRDVRLVKEVLHTEPDRGDALVLLKYLERKK